MAEIVFFSGIDWVGNNTMPCHHVVRRLARNHRILYIDNFGTARELDHHDCIRALAKIRAALLRPALLKRKPVGNHGKLDVKIAVRQPVVLPTTRGAWIRRLNGKLLSRQIQGWTTDLKIRKPIVWTRVATEPVWRCIKAMEHSLLVYQSVDKFPEHPRIPMVCRALHKPWEERFNREADLVFCSARGLWEEKRKLNPNCHFFPNGADAIFRNATLPPPLQNRRPVVGFAGAIGASLHIEWVAEVAKIRTEMDFVLVGKIDHSVDLSPLESLANVRLPGLVPHANLPETFSGFDVAIMAYAPIRFQQYTFPSKMAEYLLAGLPVVSNRIPEIVPYSNVIRIVDSPESMAASLPAAVEERFDQCLTGKRRLAGESLSWDSIVEAMEECLTQASTCN